MATDREGRQLMIEAGKLENYKGWFGQNKLEEAAEYYCKAGNAFKMAKYWKESGQAFVAQAQCCIKINEKDEAATAYMNASKSYKKVDPQESINTLKAAVSLLSEKGRFSAAANNQKQIAEMYETDVNDNAKALEAYELAADWYLAEEANAQAHACMLKIGMLAAQLEDYEKAIEKFETVSRASVDNNLTKWSVREYLMKAGLCVLCTGDLIRARQAFDRYLTMDITFSTTREYKLLADLLEALEEQDAESFTNTLVDFDKLTKLDQWKTSILLRIKKTISQELDFT